MAKTRAPVAAKSRVKLRVLNLGAATFECVFPRCGGPCCMDGRPPVTEAEAANIEAVLPKVRDWLRPAARKVIDQRGFRTNRKKSGQRMLAVVGGHCVFYADGCVLHRLGADEGDAFKHKPWHCSTFPLDRTERGEWYVRQWGVEDEGWTLFCLNPKESKRPAAETLRTEIAFVERIESGQEDWRGIDGPKDG